MFMCFRIEFVNISVVTYRWSRIICNSEQTRNWDTAAASINQQTIDSHAVSASLCTPAQDKICGAAAKTFWKRTIE